MTEHEARVFEWEDIGLDNGKPIFYHSTCGIDFYLKHEDGEYYMTNGHPRLRYYKFGEAQSLLNNLERHLHDKIIPH